MFLSIKWVNGDIYFLGLWEGLNEVRFIKQLNTAVVSFMITDVAFSTATDFCPHKVCDHHR